MRRTLITTFALALLSAVPTAAGAATAIDRTYSAEAAVWIIEEMVLLEDARAFTGDATVTAVHTWVDDRFPERDELLDVLGEVDRANAEDLLALRTDGWVPGPPAAAVLDELSDDTWQRLEDGETSFLSPRPWLDASAELLERAGAPRPAQGGAHAVVPAVLDALPVTGTAGLTYLAQVGVDGLGLVPATSAPDTLVGGIEDQPAVDQPAVPTPPAAADPATADTIVGAPTVDDGAGTWWPVAIVFALIAAATAAVLELRRRQHAARSAYRMPFDLPPADSLPTPSAADDVDVWCVVLDDASDASGASGAADAAEAVDGDDHDEVGHAPSTPVPNAAGIMGIVLAALEEDRPAPPATPPPSSAGRASTDADVVTGPGAGDGPPPPPPDGGEGRVSPAPAGTRGPPPAPWELREDSTSAGRGAVLTTTATESRPPPVAEVATATTTATATATEDGTAISSPRRRRSSATSGAAAVVIEAGRRMTAALDGASVRRIAVETVEELLGAPDAAFVDGRGRSARWAAAVPRWASADPAEQASILRVLETAQTGWAVTTTPGDEEVVVAAAPVLVDGTVVGALTVARTDGDGFTSDEVATLDLLTPVVGSALGAAETHLRAVAAAEIDDLTQLRNRRRLDDDLESLDAGAPVAFAMLDIDHFKQFNDANGHAAGDLALQLVANAVAGTMRPTDDAYRYGGEEFSVLLRGCDEESAVEILERVRHVVGDLDVPGGSAQPLGRLSISIGVAAGSAAGIDDLVVQADDALYEAKETGRDRVVVHGRPGPTDDPPHMADDHGSSGDGVVDDATDGGVEVRGAAPAPVESADGEDGEDGQRVDG